MRFGSNIRQKIKNFSLPLTCITNANEDCGSAPPSTDALPEPLQTLTKTERLLIAIRFASGMTVSESGAILGYTQVEYRKAVSDIMQKMAKMAQRQL